ncbi:MAG: glycosyltransferase [Phaeodactylibacter sp.]|uniref:glycosyltransferase n=1 Tax=Phaeodactylibacter sp. TaxID=1940289 RepID=UPI0032F05A2D
MQTTVRRVLFHRSWAKYNGGTSGGQLKVRDAFEHFGSAEGFEPRVYFGPETVWYDNPGNVWLPYREQALKKWVIEERDLLFFAGWDWKVLPPAQRHSPPVPVLNIAQPRQIMLPDARRDFLKHPAIRIAKSSVGKEKLEDYGVNGPVFFIPDAIDFSLLPAPNPDPDVDVLIVGLKNPEIAKALERRLRWYNFLRRKKVRFKVQVPPKLPTRQDFLNLVNQARIVVYLPLTEAQGAEGFYLPALEGMVMEKLVICPYAVGNADFCIPGETCLQPDYNANDIFSALLAALKMSKEQFQEIVKAGRKIANRHTLEEERKSILELAGRTDELWRDQSLFRAL